MSKVAKKKKQAKKPKRKLTQPEKISAKEVKKLAGYGCTQTEIADFYGVDKSVINKHFSTEFTKGRESCKQRLRKKQIQMALGGNVSMLIWLGKQMLGQSDKAEWNHTGNLTITDIIAESDNDND